MKNVRVLIRSILLSFALLISTIVKAEEGVILRLNNGSEVGFVFTSLPKVTMGAELQISTYDGYSVSYDYAQVSSISYGDASATAIEDVATTANKIVFNLQEGKVVVEGMKVGETVSIYNFAGQLLALVQQTTVGASLTIPLTEKGVHIICTSTGVSYKFINK